MANNEKEKKILTPEEVAAQNKKFADRRKSLETLYSGDLGVKTYVRQSSAGVANTFTETTLNRILNSVGINTITAGPNSMNELLRLTNYAYATESNYTNIINYFANMFL